MDKRNEAEGSATETRDAVPEGEIVVDPAMLVASEEQSETTTIPPVPGSGPVGRVFGRFELLIEMGQGGMATLYLARIRGPEQFQKLVAVKTIHEHLARDQAFLNMFLDEARIAALIDHPNVVTIFDLGEIDGRYFIAMEYVHGQTLTEILKNAVKRPDEFSWPLACRIVADVAFGLHAAHELRSADGTPLGVVHRDVSPQNILVSYSGSVKVVDFGVAYASERLSETVTGTLKGKIAYMSPEQAAGEQVDRRSDVFSVGVVLWECLAKRRLFKRANEAATLMAVREGEVPGLRQLGVQVPAALEKVVMKALTRDREERYQTAQELAEDIEAVLSDAQERVGRSDLSRLMDSYFHDRRKLKEEQIKAAQESNLNRAAKGVGMVESTSTSLENVALDVNGRRRVSLWIPILGAGFALTLLAVGGYFLLTEGGGKGGASKPETTLHPDTGSRRLRPHGGFVTIEIKVSPVTAKSHISFQGHWYEGPVVRFQTKQSSKAEQIVVTAPGFAQVVAVVVPVQNQNLELSLTPLPRPVKSRPKTREKAPGHKSAGPRASRLRHRPTRTRSRARSRGRRSRPRPRARKPGLMDW